ncbi:TetR/AcrR family transcriptional regulator [Terriglobus sp. TAA 43]|uniref:TetR/AcrR family transcriptional regulator n=1 Tax=Terriglobus sp. TAA 43 TaxID=278961 RepID=UPI0006463509|nr:TetR/AcrR family transcriptional regulator [Terriglobus sp. TAA 43]
MPKISEEQRQARRDQILAAAWRCFARNGIHATSMEEIIREAELSAGAVYLYYKGKDELILAAIETYMGDLRGLLLPLLMREKPLPPAAFAREITAAISSHTQRGGLDLNVIILMCWSEAQSNPTVKKLVSGFQLKYREALTHIVRIWQKEGHLSKKGKPDEVGKVLLSFFLGFIVQSALLGRMEPETAAQGIAGLIGVATTRRTSA